MLQIKGTAFFMLTINVQLPTCWQELTQSQLRYVYFLYSQNYTSDEVKTFCFCRFGGLKVLERTDTGYLVQYQNNPHLITAQQIAEQLPHLAWLDELPLVPLRLTTVGTKSKTFAKVFDLRGGSAATSTDATRSSSQATSDDGKYKAPAADLAGVPFRDYLYCDNLYTGYLHTQNADLLTDIARQLYHATTLTLSKEESVSIFYWFASLKAYYQRRFSYLFSTEPTQGDNLLTPMQTTEQRLQTAMDNQIRALTKGDVTKETEVLNTDTLRALTELNAMAREYQDLERESKK
ncbi:MAG: hypothetical protein IKN91_00190 [Paludibacteraceae bacterium]|nr:hypothetical protein [Paludibacteraceae bacterium]